jgi:hypothetical protein
MSTDNNVVPIRSSDAGGDAPKSPGRSKRPKKPRVALAFAERGDEGGPSTYVLWSGLQGVLRAMTEFEAPIGPESHERYEQLGAAADSLMRILEARELD